MAIFCVSVSVLKRDHPDFFREAEDRRQKLEGKRKQSSIESACQKKRQRALRQDGLNWCPTEMLQEMTASGTDNSFECNSLDDSNRQLSCEGGRDSRVFV